MKKVILLTITWAGESITEMPCVFTSADKARAFLAEWCRRCWEVEELGPDTMPSRMPEDDEAVIDGYYALTPSGDTYKLVEVEIDPEGGPFVVAR